MVTQAQTSRTEVEASQRTARKQCDDQRCRGPYDDGYLCGHHQGDKRHAGHGDRRRDREREDLGIVLSELTSLKQARDLSVGSPRFQCNK